MLVVGKIGRGRVEYYLDHVAPTDHLDGGLVERPGEWLAGVASLLDPLPGPVGHEAIGRLLAGLHPADGTPLHKAASRVVVAAYDLTFATPKSVSVLHALGPAEAASVILEAHRRSVAAALAYLTRHGLAVRRQINAAFELRPAQAMLGAVFVHRTSRASDPHLHAHALVANVAADGDGRYSALDGRPLYLHLHTASALYDAHLRAELSRDLGVAWRERPGGHLDLAGLPDRVLDAFSTRTRQIDEELARSGRRGVVAARVAALRTRPGKDLGRPYPVLVDAWRERAYDLGVTDNRWSALLGPAGPGRTAGQAVREGRHEARSLVEATAGLLEAPFTRRELVDVAARSSRAGVPSELLEQAADELLARGSGLQVVGEERPVLATRGRPIPVGHTVALFGGERLAALEEVIARGLDGPAGAGSATSPLGTRRVLTWRRGRHLEVLAELGSLARTALAEGSSVRAHAPGRRDAATFEALTGIPTTAGPRPPMPSPDRTLIVVGADLLSVGVLGELCGLARSRQAPLTLLVGPRRPPARGRSPQRALLLAAAEPLSPAPWRPDEPAVRAGPDEPAGGMTTPWRTRTAPQGASYASSLEEAVGWALTELARRRVAGERAVVVVADRPTAAGLDRLVASDVRQALDIAPVVHLAGAGRSCDRAVDAVIVLGVPPELAPRQRAIALSVAPIAPLERPAAERFMVRGLGCRGYDGIGWELA